MVCLNSVMRVTIYAGMSPEAIGTDRLLSASETVARVYVTII